MGPPGSGGEVCGGRGVRRGLRGAGVSRTGAEARRAGGRSAGVRSGGDQPDDRQALLRRGPHRSSTAMTSSPVWRSTARSAVARQWLRRGRAGGPGAAGLPDPEGAPVRGSWSSTRVHPERGTPRARDPARYAGPGCGPVDPSRGGYRCAMLQRTISASQQARTTAFWKLVGGAAACAERLMGPSGSWTETATTMTPGRCGERQHECRQRLAVEQPAHHVGIRPAGSAARRRRGRHGGAESHQLRRTRSRRGSPRPRAQPRRPGLDGRRRRSSPARWVTAQPGGGRCWRNAAPAGTQMSSPDARRAAPAPQLPHVTHGVAVAVQATGLDGGNAGICAAHTSRGEVGQGADAGLPPTVSLRGPGRHSASASSFRPASTLPIRSISSPRARWRTSLGRRLQHCRSGRGHHPPRPSG